MNEDIRIYIVRGLFMIVIVIAIVMFTQYILANTWIATKKTCTLEVNNNFIEYCKRGCVYYDEEIQDSQLVSICESSCELTSIESCSLERVDEIRFCEQGKFTEKFPNKCLIIFEETCENGNCSGRYEDPINIKKSKINQEWVDENCGRVTPTCQVGEVCKIKLDIYQCGKGDDIYIVEKWKN